MNQKSDIELLRAFAAERNEAAFRTLVDRYVDLVHSAALRLVVDAHLAEDVDQAVFVALAQQADAVARKLATGVPLSGWLHLTTRNVAAKTVRTETRRRTREHVAARDIAMNDDKDSARTWDELAPHLDDALASLSEPDRHALLLRFFESHTAREIGQRLGLSEDAAQKRVARALERLRAQFAVRGLPASATALAAFLGTNAVQAAPAALASGVTAAALSSVGIVSTTAGLAAWSAKLISTAAMTKTQIGVLTGLVIAWAVPITVQQRALSEVRTELRAPTVLVPETKPTESPSVSPPLRLLEAEEIERLRRDIANLQSQLAARQIPPAAPATSETPGPILLSPGRVVPLSDLVYAGAANPEAALQSYFVFQRDGDVEAALNLRLDPPHEVEKRMLVLEEAKEQLAAAMKAEVAPIQSVELLERRPISEYRTQLVIREIRSDRVVTNTLSLGRTSQGWKFTL